MKVRYEIKSWDNGTKHIAYNVLLAIIAAIAYGAAAAFTYVVDTNTPVTLSIVIVAIVIGIIQGLQYYEANPPPPAVLK